jgi:hypothetical protein
VKSGAVAESERSSGAVVARAAASKRVYVGALWKVLRMRPGLWRNVRIHS